MSYSIKKVFVTGGAGCIGLAVCKELFKRNIEVVSYDLHEQMKRAETDMPDNVIPYLGSILDNSALRDAVIGCDAIIHLAAYLGVRRTEINPLRCLEINITGTKNVIEMGLHAGIKKIIFASSSEVYGEPMSNPINEDFITQGKTVYGITKLAGEELVKAYSKRYNNLDYTILRYFNTYGINQISQFVIPKFIRSVIENKSPVIYGDGNQSRSYCFATDTAWATVQALMEPKANNQVINIGNSSEPINLKELADLIISTMGKKNDLKAILKDSFDSTDRTKDREINNRFCDTSKAEKILKYSPKVSLADGIKQVVDHGVLYPNWLTTDEYYTIDDYV